MGRENRTLGRQAITGIVQGQMSQAIDEHLDRMTALDEAE